METLKAPFLFNGERKLPKKKSKEPKPPQTGTVEVPGGGEGGVQGEKKKNREGKNLPPRQEGPKNVRMRKPRKGLKS